MTDRAEKRPQSDAILEAACHCLAQKGYAEISLREIAQKAGVALSQLHYHYKNKQGLFLAVLRSVADRYIAEIEEELKDLRDSRALFPRVAAFFQRKLDKEPGRLRLFLDLANLSLWDESFRPQMQALFADLADTLEERLLSEEDPDRSHHNLARIFLGALVGISLQAILDPQRVHNAELFQMVPNVFQLAGSPNGSLS
ncbi:MAG: TetR/AcrR family transcriptional regulator [Limnochordia bacterium]|jgi:AcrR family transcriptional regulator|nr:TetR/AcrR family transcriptional regulator [Bacillota bacterium]